MSVPAIDLADEIVELLEEATLSVELAPVRAYLPYYDLKNLDEVKVSVIPRQDDSPERGTRTTWEHEIVIDIALQKKLAKPLPQEAMDAMLALADEVCEYCKLHLVDDDRENEEALMGATVIALWDSRMLAELQLWTSVVQLTFSGER